jgi:CrcB protein
MARLIPFLLVGVGSFVGGNARFLIGRSLGGAFASRFPVATLLINVSGSFVLGLLGGFLAERSVAHADALRLGLGVGFCGGFTTFSTFEYETHALLEDGAWLAALANIAGSVIAGLVALRLGIVASRIALRLP